MTRIRRAHSSPHYNQFQRYTTKEHRNSILKLRCKSKRRARPRGVFCCERQPPTAFPAGQTRFSPDETTLRCFPSGKSHDLPDVKPLRLARQNHFGCQCATESVYWYLPAKVELPKSHFGKPSLTECALRRPPCQSELAEAQRADNTPRGQCCKGKQNYYVAYYKECTLLSSAAPSSMKRLACA